MMKPVLSQPIRIADLPQGKPTPFRLVPDAGELERLADRMGVDELRKVGRWDDGWLVAALRGRLRRTRG